MVGAGREAKRRRKTLGVSSLSGRAACPAPSALQSGQDQLWLQRGRRRQPLLQGPWRPLPAEPGAGEQAGWALRPRAALLSPDCVGRY